MARDFKAGPVHDGPDDNERQTMTVRRIPENMTPPRLLEEVGDEISELLEVMRAQHARLETLCASLEEIADSLPLDVDPTLCMQVARTLSPTLLCAHKFEENRFFPAARSVFDDKPQFDAIARRLCEEHREDQGYGEEISEALSDWGLCTDRQGAETTGYMLRGFFGGVRRHLRFETVVLISPIAARIATR